MVSLIVDNLAQITMLENALLSAKIEYELGIDDGKYGIQPPYLLVYGVPLDELRAFKWIGEHSKNG